MRHRKRTVKLGRTGTHRNAMLANMVCSLIDTKKITTTLAKAKAASSMAEKMVTLGKDGSLAARRRALAKLQQKTHVSELFGTIAPAFQERSGGYTRITKLGRRTSDSSEMAVLEWVQVFGGTEELTAPVVEEAKPAEKKPAKKKTAKKKTAKKTETKKSSEDAKPAKKKAAKKKAAKKKDKADEE